MFLHRSLRSDVGKYRKIAGFLKPSSYRLQLMAGSSCFHGPAMDWRETSSPETMDFPMMIHIPARWCPSSESHSVGEHKSHFTFGLMNGGLLKPTFTSLGGHHIPVNCSFNQSLEDIFWRVIHQLGKLHKYGSLQLSLALVVGKKSRQVGSLKNSWKWGWQSSPNWGKVEVFHTYPLVNITMENHYF